MDVIAVTSNLGSATGDSSSHILSTMMGECSSLLIEAGGGQSPAETMISAARKGYRLCVDLLLRMGYPVEGQDGEDSPLHIAAREGNTPVMQSLLEAGASLIRIDRDGKTPLGAAVYARQREAADYLVRQGADRNVLVKSDIAWVSISTSRQSLRRLVDAVVQGRMEPNARLSKGYYPIHLAAKRGSIGAIASLIQHGADLNVTDVNGKGVLHWAVAGRRLLVTTNLLSRDTVKVDAVDRKGRTPLSLAAALGECSIAEQLLDAGADINTASLTGWTPLHCAVQAESVPTIELLLSRGADASRVTDRGYTPRMIALARDLKRSLMVLPVDPWDEEVLFQKTLSHVWSVGGKILRKGRNGVQLDGFYDKTMMHLFQDTLMTFGRSLPSIGFDARFHRFSLAVRNAANVLSPSKLVVKYLKGEPILVATGYNKHSASIVLVDDKLFICNRGGLSRRPVEMYLIDQKKVTSLLIRDIRSVGVSSAYAFLRLIDDLPGQLSPDDAESRGDRRCNQVEVVADRIGHQTIGNCTWAHLEAAFFAYLTTQIKDLEEAWILFRRWRSHARGQVLSDYVDAHLKESRCIDPLPNPSLLERIQQQMTGSVGNFTQSLANQWSRFDRHIRILTNCRSID
ncbi:hypothetical protein SCG7086_AK_00190 [Chlamydiales bacterium SCGC AG-110-P3]|nr:hypothetical protein SCG7086_AK_00190 [Chlamydiales bacterium SCGC AG-110-P3]